MQPNEQSKPKKNTARPLGRLGAFLLVTLALLLITLLGVIWVLEKGPSPTITEKFCRSMRETSAIRWIPNIFLSQEEVDAFKSESTENDETETVNTSLSIRNPPVFPFKLRKQQLCDRQQFFCAIFAQDAQDIVF